MKRHGFSVQALTALLLLLTVRIGAFQILTPSPGEVINVNKYYNLTWSLDGLDSTDTIWSIDIFPIDHKTVSSTDTSCWSQVKISEKLPAIEGSAGLALALCWSPLYKDFPQSKWRITVLVAQTSGGFKYNQSVEVGLTSSWPYQRPVLPPLRNFTSASLNTTAKQSVASSGVWKVVLSIVLPCVIVVAIGCLVRFRRTYHKYTSIGHGHDCDTSIANAGATVFMPKSAVEQESAFEQEPADEPPTRLRARRLPLLFVLAALLSLGPLIALLIALVVLLQENRVHLRPISRHDFHFNSSGHDPAAFFIDYDATRYTTVASWTSSIALLLPGALTTLLWYHQSDHLERDTANARYDSLLTPYQLALLLNLKSGSLSSLWDYLKYICSRGREKQAKFLSNAGFVVLMATVLGFAIWGADTWLHVTTSTVPFNSVYTDNVATNSNGRQLWKNCSADYIAPANQTQYTSCATKFTGVVDNPILADTLAYADVVNKRHDTTAIKLVTLEGQRLAYIGPAVTYRNDDYRANTIAVRSVCKDVYEWCDFPSGDVVGDMGSARCGSFDANTSSTYAIGNSTTTIYGTVGGLTTYFQDEKWRNLMTLRNASNSFFTVSMLQSRTSPTNSGLKAFVAGQTGGFIYTSFIGCHTEFLNFTYTYLNGSISSADMFPIVNSDVTNAILFPSLLDWDPFLSSGAAATMTATSMDSATTSWIDALHWHYLPFAVIVTDQVDDIAGQSRFPMLVARIPKAPLFTLITLIVLYIVFNCCVLVTSLWNGGLTKRHRKQLNMTIAGLAASKFDDAVANHGPQVDDVWRLFEESKGEAPSTRVGIAENYGDVTRLGHRFVSFR